MHSNLTCFALAAGVLLACSFAASAAEVQGKALYKGQPLPSGTIAFHPAKGKAIKVEIQPDGTYSAKKVPVGQVKVTIDTEPAKPRVKDKAPAKDKDKAAPKDKPEKAPKYVPIPKKYATPETTPLRFEVKAGKQTADFELTD
jgi:hypothetical protein